MFIKQKLRASFVEKTELPHPKLETENDYDNCIELYNEKKDMESADNDLTIGVMLNLFASLLIFFGGPNSYPFPVYIGGLALQVFYFLYFVSKNKKRIKIFHQTNWLLTEGARFEIEHLKYTKFFFRNALKCLSSIPLFVKRFFNELCMAIAITLTVKGIFSSTLATLFTTFVFVALLAFSIFYYNILLPSFSGIKKVISDSGINEPYCESTKIDFYKKIFFERMPSVIKGFIYLIILFLAPLFAYYLGIVIFGSFIH